jgi:hypothetical protein
VSKIKRSLFDLGEMAKLRNKSNFDSRPQFSAGRVPTTKRRFIHWISTHEFRNDTEVQTRQSEKYVTASSCKFTLTSCSVIRITDLKNALAYEYIKCFSFAKNTQHVQALAVQKFLVIRKGEASQITLPNVEDRYDLISCGFPQVFCVIFLSLHQTLPITHLIHSTHTVPFIWKYSYKVAYHE